MNRSIKLLLALLCVALLFLSPGFGALADDKPKTDAISQVCVEETVEQLGEEALLEAEN